MNKLRLAVLFGGRSGEHEISIRSARTVIEQADSSKYDIVPIALAPDGEWLTPAESLRLFPDSTIEAFRAAYGDESCRRSYLTGDATIGGLLMRAGGEDHSIPIDVVFPVLHGTYGEDGTVQGLCEMADVPYVGCGVLASSTGMDKAIMKILFRDAGLPICRHVWFLRGQWETDAATVTSVVESAFGYPCFVKPANLGSSVGISRAVDATGLAQAIELAAEYDRKIIVEEALEMREIECAVIGNDQPEASLPGEYIIRDELKVFLDYTEKYSGTGNNEFVVPAPLETGLSDEIRGMAIKAFQAIDGSGLARVDFFLRRDTGKVLINEINTMPGLTDASGYPKMWAGSGRAFPEVIDRLIELALERHADKRRNKTSLL